jgi:hypothetical protein
MTKIQEAAVRLKNKYGSYRKADAATGINYAYLQKLASGVKVAPEEWVLEILGIEKRVTYVWKTTGSVS